MKKIPSILQLVPALIILQTVYYKWSASAPSVALFSSMGVEPWGRIATGLIELIVVVLLLLPSTKLIGAVVAGILMLGAITTHLFFLGISYNNDGGLLFALAILALLCCLRMVYYPLKKSYTNEK